MTKQKLFDSICHSEFLLVIEKHILLKAIHFSIRSIILKSKMMLYLKRQSEKNTCNTHHVPSSGSVPARYKNDHLSAGFASEMSNFILGKQIDFWVHGHVHDAFDYHIGKTRIVCNPRGYVPHELNDGFLADLSVEV